METEKKVWVTPELIVLVRSMPEEAVLAACKSDTVNGVSAPWASCWAGGGFTNPCLAVLPS